MLARVGIDWDNDGYINWGAKAPFNLVDNPAYTAMVGRDTVIPNIASIVSGINEYGTIGREGTMTGVYAHAPSNQWWVGMTKWKTWRKYSSYGITLSNPAYHNGDMNITISSNAARDPKKSDDGTHVVYPAGVTSSQLTLGNTSYTISANSTTLTGFTVTPNTQYYISLTVLIPKDDVTNYFGYPYSSVSVYGNHTNGGSISTVNIATYIDYQENYVKFRYTEQIMTPAGCTAIVVTKDIGIQSNGIQVTGFNLLTDNIAEIGFVDTQISNSSDEFVFNGTGTYTASFYIRKTSGYDGTLSITPQAYAIGGSSITSSTAKIINLTSDWQRVYHTFTLSNEAPVFWISKDASSSTCTFEVRGYMVSEGTQLGNFNTGSLSIYDTLDPLSISCDAAIREGMPNEGIANVVMDNVNMLYSPNNEASPLYGRMRKNIKGEVQVYTEGSWRTIWRGWTSEFQLEAGLYQSRQATINLVQGVFRLREAEPTKNTFEGSTSDQVVSSIIENSGWWAASAATLTPLGINSKLGLNTFVYDGTELFSSIDNGIIEYEFAGLGWGETSSVETLLRDIVSGEKSLLWIDRNGQLCYANREHWLSKLSEATSISLDNEVQRASYTYGADIKNRIKGFVNPKSEGITEQTLWTTVRPISLGKYRSVNLPLNFQYDDGTPATPITINEVVDYKVYKTAKVYKNVTTQQIEITGTDKDRIKVELIDDGHGGKQLRITNSWWVSVYVEATVKGTLMERTDNETWVFSDDTAIGLERSVYIDKLSSKLVATEEQARGAAQVILAKSAVADGEFTSLMVKIGDDTEKYIRLLKLGEAVLLTEGQTDEKIKPHGIVGEKFTIQNGHIQVDYQLERIPDTRYAVVGTAVARPYTKNLLEQTYTHVGDAICEDNVTYKTFKTLGSAVLLSGYQNQVLYNEDFPYVNPQPFTDLWSWDNFKLRGNKYYSASPNPAIPYLSSAPSISLETPKQAYVIISTDTAWTVDYNWSGWGVTAATYYVDPYLFTYTNLSVVKSGNFGLYCRYGKVTVPYIVCCNTDVKKWLPAGTYRLSIWYKTVYSGFKLWLMDIASSTYTDADITSIALSPSTDFTKATITFTTSTSTAPYAMLVGANYTGGKTRYSDIDVQGWSLTEGTIDFDNFDDTMIKHDSSSVSYA